MKDKKKKILVVLLCMILSTSLILISKIAFSFMGPDISDDIIQEGIILNTDGTLVYVPDDSLSITLNSDNFNATSGDVSKTVHPKVIYSKSPKDPNSYDTTYYVGFYIKKNTFVYSQSANTPELILTISDENGNPITSVGNLNYLTSGTLGFDITEKSGLYAVYLEHPISLSAEETSKTHTWTFTLTFKNLVADQSLNETAELDLDIVFSQGEPGFKELCGNDTSLACHVAQLTGKDVGDGKLIYHDGTHQQFYPDSLLLSDYYVTERYQKDYQKAEDILINKCDYFYYGGESCSSVDDYTITLEDYKFYVLAYEDTENYYTLEEAIEKAINDGYILLGARILDAYDFSYRYAGNNPNNYVCLGNILSQAKTETLDDGTVLNLESGQCDSVNNLYRIIGVMPRNIMLDEEHIENQYVIKLIKSEYLRTEEVGTFDSYYVEYGPAEYNEDFINFKRIKGDATKIEAMSYNIDQGNPHYYYSLLREGLNGIYFNNLDSKLSNLIAKGIWYDGGQGLNCGNSSSTIFNIPKVAFEYEKSNDYYNVYDYIGLISPSEYGFAALEENWANDFGEYASDKNRLNNWLFNGVKETAMSGDVDGGCDFYGKAYIASDGSVKQDMSPAAFRPSLYLKNDVAYVSGDGSYEHPFVIK